MFTLVFPDFLGARFPFLWERASRKFAQVREIEVLEPKIQQSRLLFGLFRRAQNMNPQLYTNFQFCFMNENSDFVCVRRKIAQNSLRIRVRNPDY